MWFQRSRRTSKFRCIHDRGLASEVEIIFKGSGVSYDIGEYEKKEEDDWSSFKSVATTSSNSRVTSLSQGRQDVTFLFDKRHKNS